MNRIQNITSVPYQKQTLILEDGTLFSITIKFYEMQQCWFLTELIWGDVVIRGMQISNSPNILYQYRNFIPFGIACITDGGREPSLQEDFSSGASRLYVLTAADVQNLAGYFNDG